MLGVDDLGSFNCKSAVGRHLIDVNSEDISSEYLLLYLREQARLSLGRNNS
jgi:hypothetical protein